MKIIRKGTTIFVAFFLLTINGYSQNTSVKALLDKPETRTEVFNTILGDHQLMTDFMTAMKGNDHAMMMQNNNQMMGNKGEMGMNKNNQMMGQNMPMKKYGMMVNRLPNMQQQLSLTDDQVEKLLYLQTDFKKQQLDYQAELRKKQMKLKSLLKENASANQVKKQMQDCADSKIRMKVAAYETAGKMKAVLTNEQKEQLQNKMMQQSGMMKGKGGMMNHGQGGMMQNKNNQ